MSTPLAGNPIGVESVEVKLICRTEPADAMNVDGNGANRERRTVLLRPSPNDPSTFSENPGSSQATNYRLRLVCKNNPEPSIKSLTLESASTGESLWIPQTRLYRQSLSRVHRLVSLADVMLLYEALRFHSSDAIEELHVPGFEFIAQFECSVPWRAILLKLPKLKLLKLSGGNDTIIPPGEISPFPLLIGTSPVMKGALQNVTSFYISNVRCSTLNNLLSHLHGLSALEYLSLSYITCQLPPDPAEPPSWHHHFDRLAKVDFLKCEDASSLAWLYASPSLQGRMRDASVNYRLNPYLCFVDARYLVTCLRSFCDVSRQTLTGITKRCVGQPGRETFEITFTLRNGAWVAFKIQEPFANGMGEWSVISTSDEETRYVWQHERHKASMMLSDEMVFELSPGQLTRGCTLCKM